MTRFQTKYADVALVVTSVLAVVSLALVLPVETVSLRATPPHTSAGTLKYVLVDDPTQPPAFELISGYYRYSGGDKVPDEIKAVVFREFGPEPKESDVVQVFLYWLPERIVGVQGNGKTTVIMLAVPKSMEVVCGTRMYTSTDQAELQPVVEWLAEDVNKKLNVELTGGNK